MEGKKNFHTAEIILGFAGGLSMKGFAIQKQSWVSNQIQCSKGSGCKPALLQIILSSSQCWPHVVTGSSLSQCSTSIRSCPRTFQS